MYFNSTQIQGQLAAFLIGSPESIARLIQVVGKIQFPVTLGPWSCLLVGCGPGASLSP